MRIDFDRRVLRRCRRAIVGFAIQKDWAAHKNSHRAGANERGLDRAQVRYVACDGMHRTGKTGGVYRRCRCSSGATTRIRAWFAGDYETARTDGELLRTCCQRTFARATGARYAQRRRSQKIPPGRRRNFRIGETVQRFSLRRAWRGYRAYRIYARPAWRSVARGDARNQTRVRSEERFQSWKDFRGWPTQDRQSFA